MIRQRERNGDGTEDRRWRYGLTRVVNSSMAVPCEEHAVFVFSKPSFSLPELRPAIAAATLYSGVALIVLGYTWLRTKPEYHGFDWIWAALLSYPSCGLAVLFGIQSNPIGVLIGIAGNAAGLFVLGVVLTWIGKCLVR
jgi:hypothetical protein